MNKDLAVVTGDWQIPFHDKRALSILYNFIEEHKPARIVLNGDIVDFYDFSRFGKDPQAASKVDKELRTTRDYLYKLREIAPHAVIDFIEGNHEHRIGANLSLKAPEYLASKEISKALSLEELLHLDKLKIKYIRSYASKTKWASTYTKVGNIYVGHFKKVNGHGGYTAKALVDALGVPVIQAHTHRLGWSPRTTLDGRIIEGWEGGCLCKLRAEYTSTANWQHGFLVINFDRGRTHVTPIPIRKYVAFYGGKKYTP